MGQGLHKELCQCEMRHWVDLGDVMSWLVPGFHSRLRYCCYWTGLVWQQVWSHQAMGHMTKSGVEKVVGLEELRRIIDRWEIRWNTWFP